MIEMKTTGFRELAANLRAIGGTMERRIIRAAERTALQPAAQAIRAATYTTVQRRTGLLKAGIGIRGIRRNQGPNRFAAGVFAREASAGFIRKAKVSGRIHTRTSKKGGKDAARSVVTEPFYWRFIEFGTRQMQARPYVARAFGGAAGDVLERFKRALAAGIERAARERPYK